MKIYQKFFLMSILVAVTGCVTVPKETVELSEIINEQIAEMQSSHEKFVHLYYDKLREDVDNFIREKWAPQFLSNIVEGKGKGGDKFRSDLDKGYKLSALDWNQVVSMDTVEDNEIKEVLSHTIKRMSEENNSTLGFVLIDFATAAQTQINEQRKKMLEPINKQEKYVLEELRMGYTDLLRGNAAIKGYLASSVDLVEKRDEVLEKIGALETQRDLINKAVDLSDNAAKALKFAEKADEGVDKFIEAIDKMNEMFTKLKK